MLIGVVKLSDIAAHPRHSLSARAHLGQPESDFDREIKRRKSIIRREIKAIRRLQEERRCNAILQERNNVRVLPCDQI